jgi:hypothetical protein
MCSNKSKQSRPANFNPLAAGMGRASEGKRLARPRLCEGRECS